jgi:hypothetical protein
MTRAELDKLRKAVRLLGSDDGNNGGFGTAMEILFDLAQMPEAAARLKATRNIRPMTEAELHSHIFTRSPRIHPHG